MFSGISRAMKISSVVVLGSIIAGFTAFRLEALTLSARLEKRR